MIRAQQSKAKTFPCHYAKGRHTVNIGSCKTRVCLTMCTDEDEHWIGIELEKSVVVMFEMIQRAYGEKAATFARCFSGTRASRIADHRWKMERGRATFSYISPSSRDALPFLKRKCHSETTSHEQLHLRHKPAESFWRFAPELQSLTQNWCSPSLWFAVHAEICIVLQHLVSKTCVA